MSWTFQIRLLRTFLACKEPSSCYIHFLLCLAFGSQVVDPCKLLLPNLHVRKYSLHQVGVEFIPVLQQMKLRFGLNSFFHKSKGLLVDNAEGLCVPPLATRRALYLSIEPFDLCFIVNTYLHPTIIFPCGKSLKESN